MISFPDILSTNLEHFFSSKDYEHLSNRYRQNKSGFATQKERMAYLFARMPATFAAICQTFRELEGIKIESFTDWGTGPGTGIWAARLFFPELKRSHLIDRDPSIIELGQQLAKDLQGVEWMVADLTSLAECPTCDLALFSYSLGEIPEKNQIPLLLKAWKHCNWLVVIEPGTPKGFERMISIRKALLAHCAHILAPCPHHFDCPMIGQKAWCHFSVRLPRGREHRLVKKASLNYEDEKFCYLIVGKQPKEKRLSRIVGYPQKGKGHIRLSLCGPSGLENRVITKRKKALYKRARKVKWGEVYPVSEEA